MTSLNKLVGSSNDLMISQKQFFKSSYHIVISFVFFKNDDVIPSFDVINALSDDIINFDDIVKSIVVFKLS